MNLTLTNKVTLTALSLTAITVILSVMALLYFSRFNQFANDSAKLQEIYSLFLEKELAHNQWRTKAGEFQNKQNQKKDDKKKEEQNKEKNSGGKDQEKQRQKDEAKAQADRLLEMMKEKEKSLIERRATLIAGSCSESFIILLFFNNCNSFRPGNTKIPSKWC